MDRVPLMVVGGEKGDEQGTPTRADDSCALLFDAPTFPSIVPQCLKMYIDGDLMGSPLVMASSRVRPYLIRAFNALCTLALPGACSLHFDAISFSPTPVSPPPSSRP